jgi:hypothetical protein
LITLAVRATGVRAVKTSAGCTRMTRAPLVICTRAVDA